MGCKFVGGELYLENYKKIGDLSGYLSAELKNLNINYVQCYGLSQQK